MKTEVKEIEVYPHEKFAVEIQRLGLDIDDATVKIGISRPSLTNWINAGKDPQKSKKEKIEKSISNMKVKDWRKTHIMFLSSPELLNVWRIRNKVSNRKVAGMLETSDRYVMSLFSGLKYISDDTINKITKITANL